MLAGMSALGWLAFDVSATDARDEIIIVYPKPDQQISAVDSTFILGHVPPTRGNWSYRLEINGQAVDVHADGGFIAFLPIQPGAFTFQLDAFLVGKEPDYQSRIKSPYSQPSPPYSVRLSRELTVFVPKPSSTVDADTLVIAGDYKPPRGCLELRAGDRLAVAFRGTPNCRAWFSIEGVVDSVPMSESPPRLQPYWGEAVFGAGAVPDSMKIRGIYTGFYDVSDTARIDTAQVLYHLAPPSRETVIAEWLMHVSALELHRYLLWMQSGAVEKPSSYRVSFNNPSYPFTVRFVDSVQIVRHGPRKGYLSIFQPEGVEALVVSAEGDWYRLQLSQTQFGWVARQSVQVLVRGILPPHSYLRSIRSHAAADHVRVEFPLAGKHPFRVIEDNRRTIRVQLFGVTTDTDWIRYDFSDNLIDLATWSQPEPGLYELKLQLTSDIWGYDSYYAGNTLVFQLNRTPADVTRIRGKTIVIDPGHSRDPGAIGPTGYTEAQANLELALVLKKELRRRGARVVMTRQDDRHVALYDRPAIATANEADLFVSIHNNALPDGVNPFANNGSSTYYYHLHSMDLARSIQRELLKATGLNDYGLFHGNFAVNRPTQYPAVLVECAFMILPEQEALLKTGKFRKKVAKGIAAGIERFLKEYNHGK